ncbi:DNA-binding FadR family transcriptional regulator/predicted dehydrogenase [Bradyrhizobium sp. i1.4.4]
MRKWPGSIGVDIIAGRYAEGTRLPGDAEMIAMFGVSRPVLRESVKTLVAKGLLTTKARVGTVVRERAAWNMFDADVLAWHLDAGIDKRFLNDLAEIRLAVEPRAAMLAAAQRSEDDLAELRRCMDRMRFEASDSVGFADADLALHVAVARASGNLFMRSIGHVIEAALRASFHAQRTGRAGGPRHRAALAPEDRRWHRRRRRPDRLGSDGLCHSQRYAPPRGRGAAVRGYWRKSVTELRIAIVGFGKIARDQHVGAIAATAGATLAAVASRNASLPGVPHFATIEELLEKGPPIDAVSLCTPPQVRRAQAAAALAAGKHVMLEKPPGTGVAELDPLIAMAEEAKRTLFATWHSRYAPAVEPAREWLLTRQIKSVHINWKEDVRVWHPGQGWIWEPGGLGVFDPGINALSILTRILPRPVFVTAAELAFPANCQAPIAANLTLTDIGGLPVTAEFDFRQTGPQSWDILVETDQGQMTLSGGGRRMAIDGKTVAEAPDQEYRELYGRFVKLTATGARDVDLAPLRLVADAFLLGKRNIVEPFVD